MVVSTFRGSNEKPDQLALSLHLNEHFSFENYHSEGNEQGVDLVKKSLFTDSPVFYLWGPQGVGKTHLLQAACRKATERARRAAYISFADMSTLSPEIFVGLGEFQLVCIDGVERCPEGTLWQLAMINLYHQLEENGGCLYVASRCPITDLPGFEDLRSRLAAGLSARLRPLPDDIRAAVLQARARMRGFELSAEVSAFILRRFSRDMHALLGVLDLLDRYSLIDQRRITVPYVRELLSASLLSYPEKSARSEK